MIKFTKKKTDIGGQEAGDFYGFDAQALYDELKTLNARCDTAEVEISVYPINEQTPLDEQAIRAVVLAHGSLAQVEARRLAKIELEESEVVAIEKQKEAKTGMNALPGWATWTPDEAEAWVLLNVTDLPSAKNVLGKMARAMVLFRDHARIIK